MPIYEYGCTNCGQTTEAWQRFSDPPLCECGACGGKLKKLISQNAFHLKGSGWYVTDYAGKSAGEKKASDKADKSDGKTAAPAAETKAAE